VDAAQACLMGVVGSVHMVGIDCCRGACACIMCQAALPYLLCCCWLRHMAQLLLSLQLAGHSSQHARQQLHVRYSRLLLADCSCSSSR
jgi:hypothetical protein